MNTELTEKMLEYATNKHNQPSGCQRYGSEPYTKHLKDVVDNALKYLYYIKEEDHEDVLCGARGHDLFEDTDTEPKDVEKLFNHRVADLILRVSNERGWTRKERNFKTYPKIWENDLAIFIKLCDRLSNTRNSKNSGHRMFKVYQEEYPVFRYALKVRNLYPDMWLALDELNK